MTQKEKQEQNTESEFEQAFSEAALDGAADGDSQEADELKSESEKPDTSQSDQEKGEAGDEKDDSQDDVDWRAKAEEAERERQKAEQRMSSWDGRLKKSSEELAQTKQELEKEREARQNLAERLSNLEQRSVEGDRKQLQEWLDEFGDDEELSHITGVVREKLELLEPKSDTDDKSAGHEEQKQDGAQGDQGAEPSDEERAREEALRAQQDHINAIAAKHADWADHVEALDGWIKTLPGEDAIKYAQIKQNGSADEVVAMLDVYKASKQNNANEADDDADAMAAVRHRSSNRRPKAAADKNDFDAAWDEAVSQSK